MIRILLLLPALLLFSTGVANAQKHGDFGAESIKVFSETGLLPIASAR